MVRRLLGPERFLIIAIMGVLIQFSSMLFAIAVEGTLVAVFGVIATIAIIVWIEDVTSEKSTYQNNRNCVIMVLVAMLGMSAFITEQQMTPATMTQLITEVLFMIAIAADTYFML